MKQSARLTIYLKDGREFSGIYPWICAHARIEYAQALPDYLDHSVEII